VTARGIPAQDSYPDWLQLAPAQEGEPAAAPVAPKRRHRPGRVAEVEAEETPVVEEPAADEAAE
jgi:hypothetical protein